MKPLTYIHFQPYKITIYTKGRFALVAVSSLSAVRSLVNGTWLNLVLRTSY
jgi:hypothetical protein